MDFAISWAARPLWWLCYAGAALLGAGLGLLQLWLTRRAAQGRYALFALKFGLWLAALVGAALISVPLCLVLALTATVTMLLGFGLWRRKQKREGK